MDTQLIRDRLASDLTVLPDLWTPEIQSYALTSAALVRRITGALKITDLHVTDAWQSGTHHRLTYILDGFVHYRDFYPAYVKPPSGEQVRYDYISLRSDEKNFVISLKSYFDLVRRFAHDDLFVGRYLLRRIVTMLSQVDRQPDRDFDRYWLAEVTERMYDSFTVLGKLIRSGSLVVPATCAVNLYPDVYAGQSTRPPSYIILPGTTAKRVPYGNMLAEYGTAWFRSIGRAEKHALGGIQVYMVEVFHPLANPLGSAEAVFFKFSDLLEMFKDLQQRL